MKWNEKLLLNHIKKCKELFFSESDTINKIIIYNNYISLIDFLKMTNILTYEKNKYNLMIKPSFEFLIKYNNFLTDKSLQKQRHLIKFLENVEDQIRYLSSKLNNSIIIKPIIEDKNLKTSDYLKLNKDFFSFYDKKMLKIYKKLKRNYIYLSNQNEFEKCHGKVTYLECIDKDFVYINDYNNRKSTLSHEIAHIYEENELKLNHNETLLSEVFAYTIEKAFLLFQSDIDKTSSLNTTFDIIHSNMIYNKLLIKNDKELSPVHTLLYLNELISTYLFYFYKNNLFRYTQLLHEFENKLHISEEEALSMFDLDDLVNVNLEYMNDYNLDANSFNRSKSIK